MDDRQDEVPTKRTSGWAPAGYVGALLMCAALLARQNVVNVPQGGYGWPSVVLHNAAAEVVVVPSIGRVMSFRLVKPGGAGDATPFWRNAALRGQPVDPASNVWLNFGGDKTWPAPQSQWAKLARREWPPPAGFDAAVNQAEFSGTAGLGPNQMALISPVDSHYGIRVRRLISLDDKRPVLTIETTYTKVSGAPLPASVWVVTQVQSPSRVFAVLAPHSKFPQGYRLLIDQTPTDLRRDGDLISFSRAQDRALKIGVDGETLIWVGKTGPSSKGSGLGTTLRIDTRTTPLGVEPGAKWPDEGCHAEIYTNPDDSDLGHGLTYVEMETLGPLRLLKQGESITQANTYTLRQRTETDPTAEARKMLAEYAP